MATYCLLPVLLGRTHPPRQLSSSTLTNLTWRGSAPWPSHPRPCSGTRLPAGRCATRSSTTAPPAIVGLSRPEVPVDRVFGERQLIITNVVLMLLTLFVVWGRGVEVLLGNDAG
jgi:hypothetical protein